MNVKTPFTLLAWCIVSCAIGQHHGTPLQIKEQKRIVENKIKNVKTIHYTYVDTTFQLDGTISHVEYDKNGRVLKSIDYMGDGKVSFELRFNCNSKGVRKKGTAKQFDMNGKLEHWYEIICDSMGRPIKNIDYDPPSKADDITKYFYDKAGRLVRAEERSRGETGSYVAIYKYNELGQLWEENRFNLDDSQNYPDTTIDRITRYYYDKNGNETEEWEYRSKEMDILSRKVISIYDSLGNKVAHTVYDNKGELRSIQTYQYDDKSNWIGWEYKSMDMRTTRKNDAKGNLTEEIYYRSGLPERKMMFIYEFYE